MWWQRCNKLSIYGRYLSLPSRGICSVCACTCGRATCVCFCVYLVCVCVRVCVYVCVHSACRKVLRHFAFLVWHIAIPMHTCWFGISLPNAERNMETAVFLWPWKSAPLRLPPHGILRLSFLSFHTFGGWDYATTSTTKQAHRTHIHTYININIYIYTSICTHTHIYTQAHKLTHTNICVYISERDGEEGRFERYLADYRRAQITKKTVISMK